MITEYLQINRFRASLLAFFVLLPMLPAWGQEPAAPATVRSLYDNTPWLSAGNPAGLLTLDSCRFSTASTGYAARTGDYRDVTDVSTVHWGLAQMRSWMRLENVALYGAASYAYEQSDGQSWSALLPGDRSLFRLADSVPGERRTEHYALSGAVAVPLPRRWSVGLAADYRYSTQAKQVDPRNRTTETDLSLLPGITYRYRATCWGLNLLVRKRQTALHYSNVGTEPQTVYTFFPLFFYTSSLDAAGRKNYRYRETDFGASLQAETTGEAGSAFHEFSFRHGKEQFTLHPAMNEEGGRSRGYRLSYRSVLTCRTSGKTQHRLMPSVAWSRNRGYEPVQQLGSDGNEGYWEQFGYKYKSEVATWDAALRYSFSAPLDKWTPRYAWHLGTGYRRETSVYVLYPEGYRQWMDVYSLMAAYERTMPLRRGRFSLLAAAGVHAGHGTVCQRTISPEGSDLVSTPSQHTDLLQASFDYRTASRLAFSPSARYIRPLPGRVALYGAAGLKVEAPLSGSFGATTRWEITAEVGVNF